MIKKYLLLAIYSIFLLGVGGFAGYEMKSQSWKRPKFHRNFIKDKLVEELKLSQDQTGKLNVILDRYRPEFESVMSESRQQMKGVRERMDKDIQAILTPEQTLRYDELKKERRKRRDQRKG